MKMSWENLQERMGGRTRVHSGGGGWTCGEMPQSGLCGEMADDSTDWERVSKENIV